MKPIIFDMDGVLFDSESLHTRAWQVVTSNYGIEFKKEWFLQWVGIPDRKLAEHLHLEYGVSSPVKEILKFKSANYRKLTAKHLKPFPGVVRGLESLKERETAFALASTSSGKEVQHVLSCAGLLDYFPVIVAGDDVQNHKPAPDPYLKAASLLGISPDICIAIEDSPAGIKSASTAGCKVLGVTSSHNRETLKEAEMIFPSTAEAVEWIIRNKHSYKHSKKF